MLRAEYSLLNPVLNKPNGGLESNTFIVVDGKQKCVAKLYDDNLRAEIVAQFQDRLSTAHVPVPVILPNKLGNLITKSGNLTVVLFEFVDGEPIGWGKEFASLSGFLTDGIANAVANMHKVSLAMDNGTRLSHTLSVAQITDRIDSGLDIRLSRDNLTHVRQAMIHSDLARENILLAKTRNNMKAIIDFGDSHYDYITYDIATLLTQVYVTKSWGIDFQGITQFLESYRHINPLQHTELLTILPLMVLRNKGLMQEIDQRLEKSNTNRSILESIKQSFGVKLQLLEKQGQRFEDLIVRS